MSVVVSVFLLVCVFYYQSPGIMVLGNSATPRHPAQKKERAVSKEIYSFLTQSSIVRLCCDDCIEEQTTTDGDSASGCSKYNMRVQFGHKGCRENRLVLQENESNSKVDFSWIRIRACPPGFKPSFDVCESFASGESCRQRNRCPYPHSTVEKRLWTRFFSHAKNGSGVSLDDFIDDLRSSSLRARYEVEQMWQKVERLPEAEFKVICGECWTDGNGKVAVKRPHVPECQNGHRWEGQSKKLVLDVGGEKVIDLDSLVDEEWSEEVLTAVEAARECRQRLLDLKASDERLVAEVKRLKQQKETVGMVERTSRQAVGDGFFEDDGASGRHIYPNIAVDDENLVDVEENSVYDDDNIDDDAMTVCSSDLASSDDEAYAEDPYYPLKSVAEARVLLKSEPDKYKRCVIRLDGPFSAKCRMLDEGFRVRRVETKEASETAAEGDDVIRELELRGRVNCGPCFSGDEVAVELKATRELDGDRIIYRGTVVAVLAKKIRRRAHTFVCRVDTYHSHLMKPLDGLAPKIHVVNSVLKHKYADRKDELVAVYSMTDGNLKLRKIIKLDPRQRRDMLFVVKYVMHIYILHFYTR